MGGHVNMMDDVLISNLPVELLRSSLRCVVANESSAQQPFVQHVRQRLLEAPPAFIAAEQVFDSATTPSQACLDYLAQVRCMFSSKLATNALPYLSHFVECLSATATRPQSGSELANTVAKFGGDAVQAVQALKETKPAATPILRSELERLLGAFSAYRKTYDEANDSLYPLARPERSVSDAFEHFFPSQAMSSTSDIDAIFIETLKQSLVDTFSLGRHQVPRLFNGLWQLSSPAWGSASASEQDAALVQLVEAGLNAADMADHYGDAELIYGDFRNRLPPEVRDNVFAATKWCVFGPIGHSITHQWVLEAVKERSRRLRGRVELLQFHWYDYTAKEYLDILVELVKITEQYPELVSSIGLCNFDSKHTREACEHLLAKTGKVGIVSNQVQFSLVDARPLRAMSDVCKKYDLKLLTYGTFCGGFLSSRWLGKEFPALYSSSTPLTPSQRKYLDMITTWASWAEFQKLLQVLDDIARKHRVSLTNVATRWVLQQEAVGAVIVGTRLGVSVHDKENVNAFTFELDGEDMQNIDDVALGHDQQKVIELFSRLGDCGQEYRALH
ncbi:putative aryl-alcohol dehydrogenase [Teratosphaeria nubilosa]|uniref:Putative aryl-alcohol dehydrogenase n=1 Tax=Teratosphaeria nubilosa TaxID=161662 RepID=A0A6G1LDS5_9PEZI|nr:putative aryl-alcohol dehydrogenase [Teratosphaeria nubilosa]